MHRWRVDLILALMALAGCSSLSTSPHSPSCDPDHDTCPDGFACGCSSGCSCSPGCKWSTECPLGQLCFVDPLRGPGKCEDGCRHNDGCPPHTFCPAEGLLNSGIFYTPRKCVPGCHDDSECLPEQTCAGTSCITRCHQNSECGYGSICEPPSAWLAIGLACDDMQRNGVDKWLTVETCSPGQSCGCYICVDAGAPPSGVSRDSGITADATATSDAMSPRTCPSTDATSDAAMCVVSDAGARDGQPTDSHMDR